MCNCKNWKIISHVASASFGICLILYTTLVCLLLLSFEDLLHFVPNTLFIAGLFHSDKADTPATASCKEKLLIALYD